MELNISGIGGVWLDLDMSGRVKFLVYGSDEYLENYQVDVTIHNSTGTNSGPDVYLPPGNILQSDFDDVRFYNNSGGLLNHHKAYVDTGVEADFVVNLDKLEPDEDNPFWIYYGSETESGTSDPDSTYPFYETEYTSSEYLKSGDAFVNLWLGGDYGYVFQTPNGDDDVDIIAKGLNYPVRGYKLDLDLTHTGSDYGNWRYPNYHFIYQTPVTPPTLPSGNYSIFRRLYDSGYKNCYGWVYEDGVNIGLGTSATGTSDNAWYHYTFVIDTDFISWWDSGSGGTVRFNNSITEYEYSFNNWMFWNRREGQRFDNVIIRHYVRPFPYISEWITFEIVGYFVTTNLLSSLEGVSHVLIVNSSLPSGCQTICEFSQDKSTWVNYDKETGSAPLVDGYWALPLIDLQYSILYVRLNMTTYGDRNLIYQVRVISTGEGEAPGPGVTETEFFYPLLLIGLVMGLFVAWGMRRR